MHSVHCTTVKTSLFHGTWNTSKILFNKKMCWPFDRLTTLHRSVSKDLKRVSEIFSKSVKNYKKTSATSLVQLKFRSLTMVTHEFLECTCLCDVELSDWQITAPCEVSIFRNEQTLKPDSMQELRAHNFRRTNQESSIAVPTPEDFKLNLTAHIITAF